MTFLEIQEIARTQYSECQGALAAALKAAVNRAQREIYTRGFIPFLGKSKSLLTVANQRYIVLPRDFHNDISLMLGAVRLDRITKVDYDALASANQLSGTPAFYYLWDTEPTAYHSTGNVNVTGASAIVVAGTQPTAFPADIAGMYFRLPALTPEYVIASRTNGSTLVLKNPYGGITATNQAYEIDGPPRKKLWFSTTPDGGTTVDLAYWRKLPPLINDTDIPEFPVEYHDVLIDGAYAYILQSMQIPIGQKQSAMQMFMMALARLDEDDRDAGSRRVKFAAADTTGFWE